MATFSCTSNQTLLASVSCAASGTKNGTLDLRTKLGAWVAIRNTGGGTVQSGAAITVAVTVSTDASTYETTSILSPSIATVASTLASIVIWLDGGAEYKITLTNTDTANATTVAMIYETIDSIS